MAAQTDDKKLDGAGLSVLWGLIKNIIPTVPTNVSAFTNDASYVSLLDTHNKNLVLASPSGAAGLPSFRALVAADIPDLSGTYLTSHQSIKSLTLQGDGTTVSTFTANSAALTFNFKAGSNISLTRGTNEITIANTYSYSHPTGGANTTIAAANGKVLSAITVNNLGHVTSVSSKTLAAADIPDLSTTYLTSHQSIYALKIQGDGTDVTTYTPNSATKTFNLKGGSNISLTRGTNEITIANTYSYSHPTGGANTTISAANGKVLSAITVNNLGHVTSVSSKTLSTSDIPDLSASYISTSGGGITSGSNTPLSLTSTTNYCKIYFVNSAHSRTIGISSSGRFFVSNIDGQSNEYQIWHAGNDGADSGLDADLLDGQHGSYYAAASSLSSYLPLSGGTMTGGNISWTSDSHGIYFFKNCGIEKWSGYGPALVAEGDNTNFYIRSGTNRAYNYKIIHAGNYNQYSLPLTGGNLTGALNVDVPATAETVPLAVIKKQTNYEQGTIKDVASFLSNMGSSDASHMVGVGARVKIGFDDGKCGVIQWVGTSNWANEGRFSFINRRSGYTDVEALSILANGNVGIGTASPSYKLHVNGTVGLSGINFSNDIGVTVDEYGNFKHKSATASNDWHVDQSDGTRVLSVLAGGYVGIGTNLASYKLHVKGAVGATAFTNTSDIRNKDFVSDLTMDIEQIANAPSFLFRWKTGDDKDIKAGSSAQYWNMVLPETVSAAKDEQHTLSMQYDVIALLSAITIAKEVVNDKERIRQLEQRVSQLEAQLAN